MSSDNSEGGNPDLYGFRPTPRRWDSDIDYNRTFSEDSKQQYVPKPEPKPKVIPANNSAELNSANYSQATPANEPANTTNTESEISQMLKPETKPIEAPKNITKKLKEYSAEEVGLTRLVFDQKELLIDFDKITGTLQDVKLEPGIGKIVNSTEDTYSEIIFPTWKVSAVIAYMVKDTVESSFASITRTKKLFGEIKPKVITHINNYRTQELKPNMPAEFLFYIKDDKNPQNCYKGKSTRIYPTEEEKEKENEERIMAVIQKLAKLSTDEQLPPRPASPKYAGLACGIRQIPLDEIEGLSPKVDAADQINRFSGVCNIYYVVSEKSQQTTSMNNSANHINNSD